MGIKWQDSKCLAMKMALPAARPERLGPNDLGPNPLSNPTTFVFDERRGKVDDLLFGLGWEHPASK